MNEIGKNFEREFPSLKNKWVETPNELLRKRLYSSEPNKITLDAEDVIMFFGKDIQNNCLDKQKVKDWFYNLMNDRKGFKQIWNECDDDIKKEIIEELGL